MAMKTSLREVLAFNIRNKRREQGLTQDKLAERVNTAPTYIAMIELGKRFPSDAMLERIAKALSVAPPELFASGPFHVKTVRELQAAVLRDMEKVIATWLRSLEEEG